MKTRTRPLTRNAANLYRRKRMTHDPSVVNARRKLSRSINVGKIDPTRTTTMRAKMASHVKRVFAILRGRILKLVVDEDAFGLIEKSHKLKFNVFCPTGEGGGIDPTCGGDSEEAKAVETLSKGILAQAKATLDKVPGAKWLREKSKIMYDKLVNRYGKKVAVAVVASGQAISWGAFGLGAAAGIPIWIPSALATAPGAALAELHYRIKGKGKTTENEEVDPVLVARLAREMVDELEKEWETFTTNAPPDRWQLTTNASERWRFNTTSEKVKAFQSWLRKQMKGLLVSKAEEELWNKYIESGLRKGAGRAFDDVSKPYAKGYAKDESTKDFYSGSKEQFLRDSFRQPVAKEKVKLLAGRTFDDLVGVTEVMSTQMTRTLTDALVQGKGPREVARDLNKKVDGIGQARALVISRTELIRAHAEGQLTAMELLGVEEVGIAVEWHTSHRYSVDKRGNPLSPCELCIPMEGVILKLSEAHGMIPRHPNCMCSWIPANMGEDQTDQVPDQTGIREAISESVELSGGMDATTWEGADASISRSRPESILNLSSRLRALIDYESLKINVFCATGQGGGVDASCGADGLGSLPDNKGVERKDMPQLKHGDQEKMVEWMKDKGVKVTYERVLTGDLKPIQKDYDPKKVAIKPESALRKPIIVSRGGRILDGTHHWLKAIAEDHSSVPVIRLHVSWRKALELMHKFPKTFKAALVSNALLLKESEEIVVTLLDGVWALNVFCPTGPGGGVDPGCPAGEGGGGWTGVKGSVGIVAELKPHERKNLPADERAEFNKLRAEGIGLNRDARKALKEGKPLPKDARDKAKIIKARLVELRDKAKAAVNPEEAKAAKEDARLKREARKAGVAAAEATPKEVIPNNPPPVVVPVQRIEPMVKDLPKEYIPVSPSSEAESKLQNTPVQGMKDLGGGVNETYIATLMDGTKGVWKPVSGEAEGLRGGVKAGTYYKREAATSAVASVVGMDDLVPTTITRVIDGKPGSLQKFVPEASVAMNFANAYDGEKDLARAAAFDLMIGNTDRHPGNWMLQHPGLRLREADRAATTLKIALIDNGLALPTVKGQFRSYLHNRAAFGNIPVPKEVIDWDAGKIRQALEKNGIEEPAIQLVEKRLQYLQDRARAGKVFRVNDMRRIHGGD